LKCWLPEAYAVGTVAASVWVAVVVVAAAAAAVAAAACAGGWWAAVAAGPYGCHPCAEASDPSADQPSPASPIN
jgi:urea transporter